MLWLFVIITVIAILVAVVLAFALRRKKWDNISLQNLVEYAHLYKHMQGSTASEGQFELMSLDDGNNWVEVKRASGGFIVVAAPADPAKVQRCLAMKKLTKFWAEGNQLDPANP